MHAEELLCGIDVEMAVTPGWKQLSLLLCEVQERLPEQVYFYADYLDDIWV